MTEELERARERVEAGELVLEVEPPSHWTGGRWYAYVEGVWAYGTTREDACTTALVAFALEEARRLRDE